jgi:phosphoserine aminotransferase
MTNACQAGPCARPILIFLLVLAPSVPVGRSKLSPMPRSVARTVPRSERRSSSKRSTLPAKFSNVPADYRIGIVPASDTGAVEMALWSLLGARGVDMLAWESFGAGWVTDVVKQLKLSDVRKPRSRLRRAPGPVQGRFRPRRSLHLERHDLRRPRVPNADFIPADRKGLTICDATSAAFAQDARLSPSSTS